MADKARTTNPTSWAEMAVGFGFMYCVSVVVTIAISITLVVHYLLAFVEESTSFMRAVFYICLVFGGATLWPLSFIKAVRALVMAKKKAEEEARKAKEAEANVPIARALRGGVEDNVHRGDLAIVDTKGAVIDAVGNPTRSAFIRSAGKPLQAIALMERGGAEEFGLTAAEIAIICASHCGGPPQIEAVRSVLDKAEIPEDALQAGSGIKDNCSGKHAGMLVLAKLLGHPLENYRAPDHPIQSLILDTVSAMCGLPVEEIEVAPDGCGAPIFAMPIQNMATAYARLANPDGLPKERAEACRKIVAAMQAHPEMVGGLDLQPLTGQALVAKSGAAGCYCVGILDQGAGFAMKIADGSSTAIHLACFEMLKRHGYITEEEQRRYLEQRPPSVENRCGDVVGEVELAF